MPGNGRRGTGRIASSAILSVSVVLALLLDLSPLHGAEVPSVECSLEGRDVRTVTRIIDAETLVLDDGMEVRLRGVLAPRPPLTSKTATTWPPELAATDALRRLALGKSVELAFQGQGKDRYGRLLAHVFVREGQEKFWLQGALISEGHGRAYALGEAEACLGALIVREQSARAEQRGLWEHAAFGVRNASDLRGLSRLRSTFQLVEGSVVSVALVRGNVFVNFGADWRTDFSAGFASRFVNAEAGLKDELMTLKGKRIRVRGWIERKNGPFIEIYDRASIERLD